MAQGDTVAFDQWMVDLAEALHDHETGTFYIALVNSTSPPAVGDSDPHWNGTGTKNLQTNEASPKGGSYTANGHALVNPTVTLVGGDAEIDFDDKSTYTQNAGNPTDAYMAVIYNNQANKHACFFIDLGGTFDMTTGDLTITFGAPLAYLDHT
jgi:hypothetical protein